MALCSCRPRPGRPRQPSAPARTTRSIKATSNNSAGGAAGIFTGSQRRTVHHAAVCWRSTSPPMCRPAPRSPARNLRCTWGTRPIRNKPDDRFAPAHAELGRRHGRQFHASRRRRRQWLCGRAGDATWNARLHSARSPGRTPVAPAISTPRPAPVDGRQRSVDNLYTWLSTPALVSDVQSWLNNPATNFGWALINANEAHKPIGQGLLLAVSHAESNRRHARPDLATAAHDHLRIPEPATAHAASYLAGRWRFGIATPIQADEGNNHVSQAFATRSNLQDASRLPDAVARRADVECGGSRAAARVRALAAIRHRLMHMQIRVPGHAILRAVLPMALGLRWCRVARRES